MAAERAHYRDNRSFFRTWKTELMLCNAFAAMIMLAIAAAPALAEWVRQKGQRGADGLAQCNEMSIGVGSGLGGSKQDRFQRLPERADRRGFHIVHDVNCLFKVSVAARA
jgi:hypothetical protein